MRHSQATILSKWLAIPAILLIPALLRAQVKAVTDRISYDAGSQVEMRLVANPGTRIDPRASYAAIIRYAGETSPVFASPSSQSWTLPADSNQVHYLPLWSIPRNAKTGHYEIDIVRTGSGVKQSIIADAGSFVIYRKLVKIERIELGKDFYVTGDPVSCKIQLKNLIDQSLRGLRVEFSDRYWPWIAGPAQQAAASITPLTTDLTLNAGAERNVQSSHASTAGKVSQPSIHQYGVVVWDHDRQKVLDIAFSQPVIIRPPGIDTPKPYPLQYIYPTLGGVNTSSYKHFYPPDMNFGAVRFDRYRTMYEPGEQAAIQLEIQNPGPRDWKGISIEARLLNSGNDEIASKALAKGLSIRSGAPATSKTVTFSIPNIAGLYRVQVALKDSSGNEVAQNQLELGINEMPKSILIFCAHEDDEGGWMGMIRGAIENHIPVHVVYFTSGDAGSCDRYYERSCDPSEALNFGELRMAEARAALLHLGLPAQDVYFLGLPDGGSGKIWYDHHASGDPYLSVLLASSHSPYEGLFRPNLPYARDSVVSAVEALISKFHPAVIVTAHPPAEGHIDHVVNNYFVVRALNQMVRSGELTPEQVKVYVDRVYNSAQMPPDPYHYKQHVFYVSGEAQSLAQEARWFYQSQGAGRSEGNISGFARLSRSVNYRQMLDWNKNQGWNEKH